LFDRVWNNEFFLAAIEEIALVAAALPTDGGVVE
jgi:hypothetical protein